MEFLARVGIVGGSVLLVGLLMGCGLTTSTQTGNGPRGEMAESGAGGDDTSGIDAVGGAAVGGVSSGGAPPSQGGTAAGGAVIGAAGAAPEGAVVFNGKPGVSVVVATGEDVGLHGRVEVDDHAVPAEVTSTPSRVCADGELASIEDYLDLRFRFGVGEGTYDATTHGVTGFAFDLEVEPLSSPVRFGMLASFLGHGTHFPGTAAPGHNVVRFSDLTYTSGSEQGTLDQDYQQHIMSMSWEITGSDDPTHARLCIANVVPLVD